MAEDFHNDTQGATDDQAVLVLDGAAHPIPREIAVRALELAELVGQAEGV